MFIAWLKRSLSAELFFKQPDILSQKTLELPLTPREKGQIQVGEVVFLVGQKILIQEERTNIFSELLLSPELESLLRKLNADALPLHRILQADEQLFSTVFKRAKLP